MCLEIVVNTSRNTFQELTVYGGWTITFPISGFILYRVGVEHAFSLVPYKAVIFFLDRGCTTQIWLVKLWLPNARPGY